MLNKIGRDIPDFLDGYGQCIPYPKENLNRNSKSYKSQSSFLKKCIHGTGETYHEDLKKLLSEIGLVSGMTLSFHHHLRNGDGVLNQVMQAVAELGLKDMTIAASSIFPVHAPLVQYIDQGVIRQIHANYISGPVAEAISEGRMQWPAIMYTHGGRARAIESGDLKVDAAFIAAPVCDVQGNISGADGPAACGVLGYALPDAQHAECVIAVTDTVVPYPTPDTEIGEEWVDYVLRVDSIGDPAGIVSGTTQITRNPIGLKIAERAAQVIEHSGLFQEGISFQTGAGGVSLAVAHFMGQAMKQKNIKGSFASGGITGYLVKMLEEGLFESLLDVQCFDHEAIRSFRKNRTHQSMSASRYGNPHNKGCVVNQLDVMILGATEIDLDFNVNVTTGSDGKIMGGSGGHSDTAFGSKLAIVVTQLVKGRLPIVREQITTVTTPGTSIDVLVTERGIAVNPQRMALRTRLEEAGLPVVDIKTLYEKACSITGKPEAIKTQDQIVALVEYRDGSVIDVVRKV